MKNVYIVYYHFADYEGSYNTNIAAFFSQENADKFIEELTIKNWDQKELRAKHEEKEQVIIKSFRKHKNVSRYLKECESIGACPLVDYDISHEHGGSFEYEKMEIKDYEQK